MLYFDHNASAPLHPLARDSWVKAAEGSPGNPSSLHRIGARAATVLDEARARLALRLGCSASDLFWTSGATESNNLVLHHAARTLPVDAEIWISAIEHPCVVESARAHFGARVRVLPVTRAGVVDVDWVGHRLRSIRPGLIAALAASNVTGILQPWRELLTLCGVHGVPYFCDAVQWLGRLPAEGLGACPWLSGCAHKFGGPRGIGFLKCPTKTRIAPMIVGGPQEDGRRAGTENVAGAVALVDILEQRTSAMSEIAGRNERRSRFIRQMQTHLVGAEVLGEGTSCLWNTVAVIMPETECPQRWVVKLDKKGFAVSTGSACSSGTEEPSPILLAMQCPPEKASRMLRLSGGWETSEAEWDALLQGILEVGRELGVAVT